MIVSHIPIYSVAALNGNAKDATGYALINLYDDGTFANEYVPFDWAYRPDAPASEPASQPAAARGFPVGRGRNCLTLSDHTA